MLTKDHFNAAILGEAPFKLAPGQSRPLSFRLSATSLDVLKVSLVITFRVKSSQALLHHRLKSHTFSKCSIYDPHKVTFLHPGGIVSYAILRAPSPTISRGLHCDQALPVFLSLHGAGLEADSPQVRHTLDSVPDLRGWVLFPTGVTPWSGDDWRMPYPS